MKQGTGRYLLLLAATSSVSWPFALAKRLAFGWSFFFSTLCSSTTKFSLRGKTWSVAVCVALFALYMGLRQLPPARSGPGPSEGWGAPVRAVLMLRALGDYGRLMIFPSNLHMERTVVDGDNYRSPTTWEHSVATEYLSIAGLIFAVSPHRWLPLARERPLAAHLRRELVHHRLSADLEHRGTQCDLRRALALPAQRRPAAFFSPAVCSTFRRAGAPRLPLLPASRPAASASRSALRSSDWVTPEIFYERTMAAGGNSMRVSGRIWPRFIPASGKLAKAEDFRRKVLAGMPDYPVARNNLAHVCLQEGKTK